MNSTIVVLVNKIRLIKEVRLKCEFEIEDNLEMNISLHICIKNIFIRTERFVY